MAMVEKAQTDPSPVTLTSGGLPPLLAPALACVLTFAALILPTFMFHGDRRLQVNGLGPGAWPGAILMALAAFSAVWLVLEIRALVRGKPPVGLSAPRDEDVYHYGKAITGIVLVILFGWLLPIIGFALATASFLLVWCLYGGLRNPWVVTLVPVLGTVGLLWMFMGLALMPLSRGIGPFDQFSVWLLKLIGIY
ncbi:tripartite tricarboxylate transporter TctB family protein [Paracoccus litorisediminis]|uniref:DUF1468 domain-containing protein n=1 Tax=Paracoccus litorisediminis TaxID=2006130 RepID=A0A844HUF8_9RHOB|nr:tripartite tricarboxylate transporter TctB family protein [Paracoccus litorisediminis]MTH61905.1 hypothetical protein [Paracoccus litorisediminis]